MNTMAYNRSRRVFAYIVIAIFAVLVFLAKSYNKQLQKELLSCDEECDRFGRLLDTWPVDKPKAAIIMLLQPSSVDKFARSAHLFTNHFNDAYDYPMIVFHEENLNTEGERQRLRSLTNSSLYFQVLYTQATSECSTISNLHCTAHSWSRSLGLKTVLSHTFERSRSRLALIARSQ